MKFLRIGRGGFERPAVIDNDGFARDLSAIVPDISPAALARLGALRPEEIAALPRTQEGARVGACIADVPNIIAIGLNYSRHAQETNNPIPIEPIVFSKHTGSITGPFDAVERPAGCSKLDWEVELGVIIGRPTYQIAREDALSCVFGYCTVNDISERDLQLRRGGQWLKGKSNPGFAPIGPWLVRADAIPDPQNLKLTLSRNGHVEQNSTTADMIFDVAMIVSYLSEFMRLIPGDLIVTGTPEGIGSRKVPPSFLLPGDLVEAEVETLGRQRIAIVGN